MKEVTIIGVDLAKNVLQLHGAAADGAVVICKKLSRPAEAALDGTLSDIEQRYGPRTAAFVANQLEYQWTGHASASSSTDGGYETQAPGA